LSLQNRPDKLGRNLTVIFGPPGTGKTTRLLDILDGLLAEGVPSTAVAFVSFTKAARAEAVERVGRRFKLTPEDLPWFRTLHSAARYFIPGKVTVMKSAHWREFCKKYHYTLTDVNMSEEDDPTVLPQLTEDDEIRAAISWGRLRCLTWDQTLRQVKLNVPALRARAFKTALDTFKAANSLIDFEDMLELANNMPDAKPLVKVAIIDEAQDLSPLLAKTVHHFFRETDTVYVAGDDDQAIYEFQAADPSWLMGMREVADTVQLLGKSYRIPAVVHTMAQRIIGLNKFRVPKEYTPREEQGHIFAAETIGSAANLIPAANGGSKPRSVFVLARNWKGLETAKDYALANAIPFSTIKQNSAPLDQDTWVRGLNCAIALQRHEDVLPADFAALLESIPSRVKGGPSLVPFGIKDGKNGVSQLPKGIPLTREDIATRWDLTRFFDVLDQDGPVAVFQKPARKWPLTPEEVKQTRDYFGKVIARYGSLPKPLWFFSSAHSVKGSEADVVVLMSDMSKKSYESLTREGIAKAEAENRLAYVAVTRARRGLILVAPTGQRAYPYGQLARGLLSDPRAVQAEATMAERAEPVNILPDFAVPTKPYLNAAEKLVIPFECELKYRWWAGGQSIIETLFEIGAPPHVIARYNQEIGR